MAGFGAYAGAYEARRAAALSGVPVSTVYDWARKGLVVPSVSPTREKLWSYANLMTLRIVAWLRHRKAEAEWHPSPMSEVRRALAQLEELGLNIWSDAEDLQSPLLVDREGHVYVAVDGHLFDTTGQTHVGDFLDLLGPFQAEDLPGPDLRWPRPHLRIIPGKCAGEPHLRGSRLTTNTVAALAGRGYDLQAIGRLYPDEDPVALEEAVDLEQQLQAA